MPKITALTALAQGDVAVATDVLPIVDVSAGTSGTKKIVVQSLIDSALPTATGLPISTGVSGLGSGVATFLATPSSANLRSAVTDETGTGSLVFATSPTLVTPVLGAATATTITVSGVGTFGDGAVGAPGIAFGSDPDNGFYRIGANNWAASVGGAKVLEFSTTGVSVTGTLSGTGAVSSLGASSASVVANQNGRNVIMGSDAGTDAYVGTTTAHDMSFIRNGSIIFQTAANGLVIGSVNNTNNSIELGYTGGAGSTPFIDFHSGATATDYDARLIASGGTGTDGGGTLQAVASTFAMAGSATVAGTLVVSNQTSLGGAAGSESLRANLVASAVNRWEFNGSVTTGTITAVAAGSDTNIATALFSKGSGSVFIGTAGGTSQFFVSHTATAVNQVGVTGSATGNAVTVFADGSDANIDLALAPKGTGVVKFGTHTALGAETVTGYLTVKDAAGNTRKLAVVS